jgi:hypothetical protein
LLKTPAGRRYFFGLAFAGLLAFRCTNSSPSNSQIAAKLSIDSPRSPDTNRDTCRVPGAVDNLQWR